MLSFFRMRPITGVSLLAALVVALLSPPSMGVATRALIGWDVGAAFFILAMIVLMARTDLEALRRRAEELDGGRASVLVVTLAAAAISVGAITLELVSAGGDKSYGAPVVAFCFGTIALSWTLTHLMFSLHYAHEYYSPDDGDEPGGLKFPGDADPTYGDFAHFSFVIGCAAQTADVAITSRALRRVVTAHCIAAFVFNTAIVALTINIAAGLIGGK